VFERFTERARQVVVLAQDEARALGHQYIGTEHLLLGLLREEEGLAARALASSNVTIEEVRAQVERIVGRGVGGVETGQIPFTPRAKKTLELALRESQALGHNYIGTEHILLGLTRQDEGVAGQILSALGADGETVRVAVSRLLGGAGGTVQVVAAGWPRSEDLPRPRGRGRSWLLSPVPMLVAGWLLFALALGAGILVGWAIWG
jgi:ATP-dependent Clp protease ATP-binding subunit ClpC